MRYLSIIFVFFALPIFGQGSFISADLTGVSVTNISGDTYEVSANYNDVTGVSGGTDVLVGDQFWTPALNPGDTCRVMLVTSIQSAFAGQITMRVDAAGQGAPSTQNGYIMRAIDGVGIPAIAGGSAALRECISRYYADNNSTGTFSRLTSKGTTNIMEVELKISGSWITVGYYDEIAQKYSTKEPVYVYADGQSNMIGFDTSVSGNHSIDSSIVVWNHCNLSWEIADIDGAFSGNSSNPNTNIVCDRPDLTGSISPVIGFARRLLREDQDRIIRIVVRPKGSTAITQWLQDGVRWGEVTDAITLSGISQIDAILWLQGESDMSTVSYRDSLQALYEKYNTLSAVTESTSFIASYIRKNDSADSLTNVEIGSLNFDSNPNTLSFGRGVDTLQSFDGGLHFSNSSTEKIGSYFYDAWRSAPSQGGNTQINNPVSGIGDTVLWENDGIGNIRNKSTEGMVYVGEIPAFDNGTIFGATQSNNGFQMGQNGNGPFLRWSRQGGNTSFLQADNGYMNWALPDNGLYLNNRLYINDNNVTRPSLDIKAGGFPFVFRDLPLATGSETHELVIDNNNSEMRIKPIATGGDSPEKSVNQANHGLTLYDPIYYDVNTSSWQIATNTSGDSLAWCIVTEVVDVNNFKLQTSGLVSLPGHPFEVGASYFLGSGFYQKSDQLLEGEIARWCFSVLDSNTLDLKFSSLAYEVDESSIAIPDNPPTAESFVYWDNTGTPSYQNRYATAGLPNGFQIYQGNNPTNVVVEDGKTYVFRVDNTNYASFPEIDFDVSAVSIGGFFRVLIIGAESVPVRVDPSLLTYYNDWTGRDKFDVSSKEAFLTFAKINETNLIAWGQANDAEYEYVKIQAYDGTTEVATLTDTPGWANANAEIVGAEVVEIEYAFRTAHSGGDINVQMSDSFIGWGGATIPAGDRVTTLDLSGTPHVITAEEIFQPTVSGGTATTLPQGLYVTLKIKKR